MCIFNLQFKAQIQSIDRNDNGSDGVAEVEPAVNDDVEPTEDEQATEQEPSVS